MKIALCQMEVVAKRPTVNLIKAQNMVAEASIHGADVVVFPEMTIPGYMVGDMWEDESFLMECSACSKLLVMKAKSLGVTVIFGTVSGDHDFYGEFKTHRYDDGRPNRFNSACVGTPRNTDTLWYQKRNLPNYREFDDKRYFAKGVDNFALPLDEAVVSVSICEDGWDDDYEDKPIPDVVNEVSVVYKKELLESSSLHFNLSCSPFTVGKNGARHKRFAKHSENFDALCYVNCVGIQNNGKDVFTFDGGTTVYHKGAALAALPPFQECIGYIHVYKERVTLAEGPWMTEQKDPSMGETLVYGTRKFLEQIGMKRAVIGLSGGIDSALSAMIHVQALGPQNVILVNMPTKFNSETTKGIAADIAKNLGCPYMVIPIGDLCKSLNQAIIEGICEYEFADITFPHVYKEDSENIAARMRGAGIQAALAAGFQAVFPNNGNKSEVTVGYCTMYGDHAGYLAPIADLWKTEVYEVAHKMSEDMGGILPESIFTLKPSAELSENHNVDQGKGDPMAYWYHDKLFAYWMEPWTRQGIEGAIRAVITGGYPVLLETLGVTHGDPADIAKMAVELMRLFPTKEDFVKDLERWWGLFNGLAVAKRVQSPPILAIKRRAYGFDFRESIGNRALSPEYVHLKIQLLG
jgi:NAD+ synthase (glutamine-hydrolysing)